jgi:transcriptional regulator with XRE-family HTH domain
MDARARIKSIMAEKGLSARKVSLDAGLSDSMVHKYLTGQTDSITVDNLEKIAKALGVSFRHLMFGDPESDKVAYIWDRISERDRQRALRVLEGFVEEEPKSAG